MASTSSRPERTTARITRRRVDRPRLAAATPDDRLGRLDDRSRRSRGWAPSPYAARASRAHADAPARGRAGSLDQAQEIAPQRPALLRTRTACRRRSGRAPRSADCRAGRAGLYWGDVLPVVTTAARPGPPAGALAFHAAGIPRPPGLRPRQSSSTQPIPGQLAKLGEGIPSLPIHSVVGQLLVLSDRAGRRPPGGVSQQSTKPCRCAFAQSRGARNTLRLRGCVLESALETRGRPPFVEDGPQL